MKNLFLILTCLIHFVCSESELFGTDWLMRIDVDDSKVAERIAHENNFTLGERISENFFSIKPVDAKSKSVSNDEKNIRKSSSVVSLEKVRYLKWSSSSRFGPYSDIGSTDN